MENCYIQLKLFATLSHNMPTSTSKLSIKPGTTIEDLVLSIGLQKKEIKLIFINGRKKNIKEKLKNGDRVGLFPPVGGG